MALPAWYGAGTPASDGNGLLTLPFITGVPSTGMILAHLNSNYGGEEFDDIAGWTLVSVPVVIPDGSSGGVMAVIKKDVVTGSEAGSVDIPWTGVGKMSACMYGFTGADSIESESQAVAGSGTTVLALPLDTTGPDRLCLYFGLLPSCQQAMPAISGSNITWTERSEVQDGAGTDGNTYQVQTGPKTSAGNVTQGSFTIGTPNIFGSYAFAIYTDTGGGGGGGGDTPPSMMTLGVG